MTQARRLFSVALRGDTYIALAYVLLRLPLAALYAALFTFALTEGFRNPTTLLLLVPAGLALWGTVLVERVIARNWFGAVLLPLAPERDWQRGWWQRLKDVATNPVTWKAIAYAALQVPLGFLVSLASACLLLTAVSAALGGIVLSFVGVLDAFPGGPGGVPPVAVIPALLLFAAGVAAFAGCLQLVRWLARVEVAFVQVMLGMSRTQIALTAARAEAQQERARAEVSDRSRRDLVLNVSHELRNPLATIRAHVDTLQGDEGVEPPAEDRRRYLQVLGRETERLGALVEELLTLASADTGELQLELTTVDVAEVASQVHEAMAPLALRERHIRLLYSAEPLTELVVADRRRLAQVLMNLVRNAITHTPDGGLVSIEVAAPEGGPVEMSVSDTGPGIPEDEAARIFERFYRADSSRARATGGFGLGLAIAREMVEAMGGRLKVESVLGQGSRFTVTLGRA